MKIGFSNGNFWQLEKDDFKRLSDCSLQRLFDVERKVLELHSNNIESIKYLLTRDVLMLRQFEKVSLHMPKLIYKDNVQTHDFLSMVVAVCHKYGIFNTVFHADIVKRWDVVASYDLPISVENMDKNKKFGNVIADIRSVLDRYDFGLTLDLNHCYETDPTMQTAMEFQKLYKERIVEYHISGYDKEKLHVPLFKTKQDIIINSLLYPELPIVIESEFESYDQAEKEINYIKDRIIF